MPSEKFSPEDLQLRGKLDLDIYTVRDIVIRTGLVRDTIHHAIRSGGLKAKNFGGARGYIVMKKDLLAYLSGEAIPA